MHNLVESRSVITENEIIFKSNANGMYVSEVDSLGEVLDYTPSYEDALGAPNTLNFKNSTKYLSLIQNPEFTVVNRIRETKYNTFLEEL